MNPATFNLLFSLFPVAENSLLTDILRFKNIVNVVDFNCNNIGTTLLTQKTFSYNKIRYCHLNSNWNTSFSLPYSYSRLGLILNTTCENWSSALDYFDAKSIFKSPYNWFIFTEDVQSTYKTLSQYPIEIDSDVVVIYKDSDKFFTLYEMYNTGYYTNGVFVMNKIGYWNSSLQIKNQMRMNLSGVILKASVVITQKVANETFEEYVERSRISKSDTLHKLKYFTLLKYLRDMYQMSYDMRRTNSWGYLHNGSFDGMIGTLQREETDIGGSPIFFRLERAKVVDSTIEVWQSRPVFILRHPKHPGGYFTIFTRPLTNTVWYCILLVLAAAAAVLSFMLNLKVLMMRGDDQDTSASLAVLIIWSAICQQGSSISRNANSIKLVLFVTCVFTLTIYQYYNATVVSTLLREPPKNIRTPKDLLKSNLRAGVHDVLYNKDFFKRTTDPIALEMYSKKIVTPAGNNFFSLEQGMVLVKRGGFAFLVDNSIAYGIMRDQFNEAELCDAHEIALYPPQNMVAVVKKGSPYKEHFSYGLRKMFEAGLMRRIKSVWDTPKPDCVRTPDSSLISVSIREFATPLVMILFGFFIAALILIFEILAHSFLKSKGAVPTLRTLRTETRHISIK